MTNPVARASGRKVFALLATLALCACNNSSEPGILDRRFGDTAARHFNSLTVPLYPVSTHPAPGVYDFTEADRAVALAESAGHPRIRSLDRAKPRALAPA